MKKIFTQKELKWLLEIINQGNYKGEVLEEIVKIKEKIKEEVKK